MAEPIRTTCPYCGVGCGVLVTPDDDGGYAVKGDPDHPANYGRLCSKGSALGETLRDDGRLLYPTVDGQRARPPKLFAARVRALVVSEIASHTTRSRFDV